MPRWTNYINTTEEEPVDVNSPGLLTEVTVPRFVDTEGAYADYHYAVPNTSSQYYVAAEWDISQATTQIMITANIDVTALEEKNIGFVASFTGIQGATLSDVALVNGKYVHTYDIVEPNSPVIIDRIALAHTDPVSSNWPPYEQIVITGFQRLGYSLRTFEPTRLSLNNETG